MSIVMNFNRLFVFSEKENLCFLQVFSKNLNIIGGRNTAGKSTLIQSLLFCLGINDVKGKLSEILKYDPIFRLDFQIKDNGITGDYVVIRDCGKIYFQEPDGKVVSFSNIDSNNTIGHADLKKYISNIFNFSMKLEKNGILNNAYFYHIMSLNL